MLVILLYKLFEGVISILYIKDLSKIEEMCLQKYFVLLHFGIRTLFRRGLYFDTVSK